MLLGATRARPTELLTIEKGNRRVLSPAAVLAWASAQPEYDVLLAAADAH